ncbi:MAG: UvrD-helicase domain-containing protein [Alteromonadales bacterium]|nr:UvrD-helicase domain-containing protein [Alteromonadales bacterium]
MLKAIAFDEFLRDSSIESLNRVWPIVENYRKNPKSWHKYFSVEHLSILNELRIFPNIEALIIGLRDNYEKTTLITQQHFYDNIEANPLTMEQRLAVIRDNDKNLILAAAGTGKTSVMVAKALDLIDRKLADPEKILILAYNKEVAK